MRKALLTLGLFILLSNAAFCESIRARTEEGKIIILNPDGSWHYEKSTEVSKAPMPSYTKPESATELVDGKILPYGIWIDPKKWKLSKKKSNEDSDLEFSHISGGIYAQTIPEPFQFSVQDIKDIALSFLLESDPDAKIVSEENKNLNGKDVVCARMDAKIQSIPMVYLSCYYSDDRGTIQIQTFTSSNVYEKYKKEMNIFLSGFIVYENFEQIAMEKKPEYEKKPITYYKKPLSSKKSLTTERVKSRIWFDENKWRISDQPLIQGADLSFVHSSSEVWAAIVSERLQITTEAYRDFMLNQMRNSSSIKNISILSEERRSVNGKNVLYLSFSAEIQKIKIVYSLYIYVGSEGTIKATVWTMANLFKEYKNDMRDLLNGIEIVQMENQ